MLSPCVGLDIGAAPAAVVAGGTWEAPFLLAARRWSRWSSEVAAQLLAWRAQWPDLTFWRELTFDARFHVGQTQAEKAADLAGEVGMVFCTNPVESLEAWAAWDMLGRIALGDGAAGEHLRDAEGVAMKAILITRTPGVSLLDYTPWNAQQRWRKEQREKRGARSRGRRARV